MTAPAARRGPPWPVSDHCDGTRFFNPGVNADRSLWEVFRWRMQDGGTPWPARVSDPPAEPPPRAAPDGTVAVTMVGHATLLLQLGGTRVVTDPVFAPCAGPLGRFGPRRVRPAAWSMEALGPLDAVLLSHNHFDHCDLAALATFARAGARVVCPLGHRALLGSAGITDVEELDWWEATTLPGGARVTLTPAQHWSRRGPTDRRAALWGGFVVEAGGRVAYYAGDTGWNEGIFRDVAARLPRADVALLPIGAYEPRWFMQAAHMDPDEAVRAHQALGARASVPFHYGTFRLSDEGIDAPLARLAAAVARAGLAPGEFAPIPHGGTRVFG